MFDPAIAARQGQGRALWLSTVAFTVCFAVWTIFAIIGVRIKDELGLNETQFGLLVGTPILTGSLIRLALGIWTDQFGGRLVFTLTMLAAATATVLLSYAQTYPQMLLAALGVGAASTNFVAPFVLVAYGWHVTAQVWATGVGLMAIVFWLAAPDDPVLRERRARGEKPPSMWLKLAPL